MFVQSMQCRIWPSCFTLSLGGVTDQKLPRKKRNSEQIALNAKGTSKGLFYSHGYQEGGFIYSFIMQP